MIKYVIYLLISIYTYCVLAIENDNGYRKTAHTCYFITFTVTIDPPPAFILISLLNSEMKWYKSM